MTTTDAKAYLAKREIPQLFESLMTGLMYYRPDDHITYLQDCLRKVQDQGVDTVRWNLFIEQRRKTPLPPIGTNGHSPAPGIDRDPSFVTETRSPEPRGLDDKGVALPPISGQDGGRFAQPTQPRGTKVTQRSDRASPPVRPVSVDKRPAGSERRLPGMPTCPIVLVMGGPGSGRATQCTRLIERYSGWVHLSIGDLLRTKIFTSGSADDKWDAVGTLIKNGEMAPEDVTMDLLKSSLQSHMNAAGIILEGFPRTLEQVQQLESVVGNIDLAFVLDCEENYLQQRLLSRGQKTERPDDNMKAIANRISFFKENTLPVIKHYDDKEKIVIIDGDRDMLEIFYDLSLLFDHTFYTGYGGESQPANAPTHGQDAADSTTPRPPSTPKPRSPRPGSTRYSRPSSRTAARPGSGFNNVPRSLELDHTDTGRQPDLPDCPIMLVLGGPGVKRLDVACKLIERKPGHKLLSMGQLLMSSMDTSRSGLVPDDKAVEALSEAIKNCRDVKGIVIEGFPRNKVQMEELNKQIGGVSVVLLIDCERDHMEKQLLNKGIDSDEIERRISYYKYNTLPIIAHFDDLRKLVVVNGEQDEASIIAESKTGLHAVMVGHGTASPEDTAQTDTPVPTDDAPSSSPAQDAPTEDEPAQDAPTEDKPAEDKPTEDKPTEGQESDQPVVNIERLEVSVADSGRKPGGPGCCLIAIVGSPGSGADGLCKRLTEKFSGYVHVNDLSGVQNSLEASGIIMENYPSKKAEIEQFNEQVGGMDRVIVLDCEEEYARQNAGSRLAQLDSYKNDTLPALAHYEDQKKLEYVNVERDMEDVFEDLCRVVQQTVDERNKDTSGSASKPLVSKLELETPDSGRKETLAGVPIIAVIGNTGDNVTKLAESMPGVKHLKGPNVSVPDIIELMDPSTEAKGILLENFPIDKEHVEEFNAKVGGITGVVMMDASESYLKDKGIPEEMMNKMQQETFPILAHYEDLGKLEYVDSEKEDSAEVLSRAVTMLVASMASS